MDKTKECVPLVCFDLFPRTLAVISVFDFFVTGTQEVKNERFLI